MNLSLIASLVLILIGLISIVFVVLLIRRFTGKLKSTTIFLMLAIIIFIIKESVKIYGFIPLIDVETIKSILNGIIILSILIAIFNMRQMVNGIDGYYNHKKRKK